MIPWTIPTNHEDATQQGRTAYHSTYPVQDFKAYTEKMDSDISTAFWEGWQEAADTFWDSWQA